MIEDSNCSNVYVYKRGKEIFLFKLEDVCETITPSRQQTTQSNELVMDNQTSTSMANENETSFDLTNDKTMSTTKASQQQHKMSKSNVISRRPSYVNIMDSEVAASNLKKTKFVSLSF